MKFILIAFGVLVFFWLISLIIHHADKRAREKYIAKRQAEKKDKGDTPPWRSQ